METTVTDIKNRVRQFVTTTFYVPDPSQLTDALSFLDSGIVDSTGVQDLYFEASSLLAASMKSVGEGETQPDAWIDDPGFALTQGNMAERELDMWGCKLFHGK